jgi:hypothetical protein
MCKVSLGYILRFSFLKGRKGGGEERRAEEEIKQASISESIWECV